MKSKRFLSLSLLLPLLLVWGCSDDSNGTGPDDNPGTTGPKVGARYEIDVYQLTSAGQQLPGVVNEGTIRLTSLTEEYRGRTNVHTFLREEDNRVTYLHIDDAGDLFFYSNGYGLWLGPVTPPMWVRYPTGTKEEFSETLADSTIVNSGGENERFIVKRSVKYLGEEAKSVEGKSYTAHKVWEKLTMELLDESGETVSAQRFEGTFWFAPEIRYFVQYDAGSWIGDLDNPTLFTGSRDYLVKYTEP